jgi:hypothetical protein
MKPLLMEMKAILSHILNSNNISLRRKSLEFVLELMSVNEMDFKKAEMALKCEMNGKQDETNKWINRILLDIDKLEYE